MVYRNAKGEKVKVAAPGQELVSDELQAAAIAGKGAAARSFDAHNLDPAVKTTRRRGVAEHILTGLLECAQCGRNMFFTGESYVCGSTQGGRVCPKPARVTGKAIEPYVFEMWRAYVLYDGPAAQFFRPAHREAVAAVREAEANLARFGGVRVDISFLLDHEQVTEYWERLQHNKAKQRELLGLAIERIYVQPSPYVGARFNGEKRVRIQWVNTDPE